MAKGTHPSKKALEARDAQSRADRTGAGKENASEMQSEADVSDLRKH